MKFYVLEGEVVMVDNDPLSKVSRSRKRYLLMTSQFIISKSFDFWKINKNRYNGEELKFFSFQDALDYCKIHSNKFQRHNGFTTLDNDGDVESVIKKHFPRFTFE